MIIAVDTGNNSIKTPNFSFTSAIEKHSAKPPLATDMIEYDGHFWSLSGQRINYMMDKTRDERFFVLTLMAVAKELSNLGNISPITTIDLAVGLPPEHFTILREKFANYFKREPIEFAYNGTAICLIINNVFVYPQAYAAVVPQADTLLDIPRIFIVDIGGCTTDAYRTML